ADKETWGACRDQARKIAAIERRIRIFPSLLYLQESCAFFDYCDMRATRRRTPLDKMLMGCAAIAACGTRVGSTLKPRATSVAARIHLPQYLALHHQPAWRGLRCGLGAGAGLAFGAVHRLSPRRAFSLH